MSIVIHSRILLTVQIFIGDYKQVFSAHFCNEDLLWLFCSCKILNELPMCKHGREQVIEEIFSEIEF